MSGETIFAVSSGRPPAAIAVVRVSGPHAVSAVEGLAGDLPPPRVAALRALQDAAGGLLDRALVLVFPGPASATGEDVVELHCHGGRAVVAAVEAALGGISGLRPALPGEFTRRALENGRIDLFEAEGLADLLEAETEAQRVAALQAAEGRVSRCVRDWMDRITMLSAEVEASIDFAEEDEVGDASLTIDRVIGAASAIAAEMREVLHAPPVERLRDGVRIVIAGPPNSGKSTLLNLLAERNAAIVSPVAGTTRDRIEAPVHRGGVAYLLTDTAGLRETGDEVEAIGIRRAADAVETADIVIWLGDTAPPAMRARNLWVHARADASGREVMPPGPIHAVAASDSGSVVALWSMLQAEALRLLPTLDQLPLKLEQRRRLSTAAAAIGEKDETDLLIVAERFRVARSILAQLLGLNATEAALDAIFSRFCLGK